MNKYSKLRVGPWVLTKVSEFHCIWSSKDAELLMAVPPEEQNVAPYFEVELNSGNKFRCDFRWWSYLSLYSMLFMKHVSAFGVDSFDTVFENLAKNYSITDHNEMSSEDAVKAAERLLKGYSSEGS